MLMNRRKKNAQAMAPALMTLEEVASYLRLSKDTVYRMASAGKLPASKVGSQWRFRKVDVDLWLEKNKNVKQDES